MLKFIKLIKGSHKFLQIPKIFHLNGRNEIFGKKVGWCIGLSETNYDLCSSDASKDVPKSGWAYKR